MTTMMMRCPIRMRMVGITIRPRRISNKQNKKKKRRQKKKTEKEEKKKKQNNDKE